MPLAKSSRRGAPTAFPIRRPAKVCDAGDGTADHGPYGTATDVPSPLVLIVKVPTEVFGV